MDESCKLQLSNSLLLSNVYDRVVKQYDNNYSQKYYHNCLKYEIDISIIYILVVKKESEDQKRV